MTEIPRLIWGTRERERRGKPPRLQGFFAVQIITIVFVMQFVSNFTSFGETWTGTIITGVVLVAIFSVLDYLGFSSKIELFLKRFGRKFPDRDESALALWLDEDVLGISRNEDVIALPLASIRDLKRTFSEGAHALSVKTDEAAYVVTSAKAEFLYQTILALREDLDSGDKWADV